MRPELKRYLKKQPTRRKVIKEARAGKEIYSTHVVNFKLRSRLEKMGFEYKIYSDSWGKKETQRDT